MMTIHPGYWKVIDSVAERYYRVTKVETKIGAEEFQMDAAKFRLDYIILRSDGARMVGSFHTDVDNRCSQALKSSKKEYFLAMLKAGG